MKEMQLDFFRFCFSWQLYSTWLELFADNVFDVYIFTQDSDISRK